VISYAHLLLPQHKSKTDTIVEYLDCVKRPKVNLELGEGSEESMKYALDRFINHNCLDSLSMNEMECKKYFKAESTALKNLMIVTTEKIKEYGLNRICIHSPEFAFSISKNDPQKEFQALQIAHHAASALTMGGIKSFWHKTDSLKQSNIRKMEKRIGEYVLCVIPAWLNPEPRILTGLGDTFAAVQAVAALS
jgi:ADP-dependent phosphofructokinase/glucokinase